MMIDADVGTTFQLGRYTVRIALRQDNPAFAKYIVFRGDRLVGKQFSRPSLSDCEWHDRWRGIYAARSTWRDTSEGRRVFSIGRVGRPTNAERARRAALLAGVEEVT